MNNLNQNKIMNLTTCNGHLGGILGEALLSFFLKEELIKINEKEYFITQKGWDELEIIGIDVEKLRSEKKKTVNICFESNHGILYEHVGEFLGNLLMNRMIELNWIRKKNDKLYELTEKGLSGLESMGIKLKNAVSR
ncbi:hypothetical protein AYK21_05390 [Thermoplasmatales archaeon SG8-52-2]|nr:MAG: hypothetical protein AYK21_05390 [Thermoplasmatales archaeon SG8-52-2]